MGRTFGQHSALQPASGEVLTDPAASGNVGGTVALKENQIQLVTNLFGDIPGKSREGHGLYMRDTRYLSQFELVVNGRPPIYLSHSADRNYIATFQFVNHSFALPDGTRVPRQTISIRRSRFVDAHSLYERIGFYNCNQFPVTVEIALTFDADFADIFAVRDFASQQRGPRSSVQFGSHRLSFAYQGRDRVRRRTIVDYDLKAEPRSVNSVLFRLTLQPHVPVPLILRITPQQSAARIERPRFDEALDALAGSYAQWHQDSTSFETSNELFDRAVLRQSRLDIRALLERADGDDDAGLIIPTAGIPWYAVPFGRDSIITALQTLMYNPSIAEGTLRFLARHQGTKVNERTEEEPGKIFHELRRGELASLGEIPHLPYFGTVDATPLFVILFVETLDWLGLGVRGQALYKDLLPNVMAAIDWCDKYGDLDGDGYVEYLPGGAGGVINKGWKDSYDSLQYEDGTTARLPAALIEVQAYVYAAKVGVGRVARERGDVVLANRLEEEAHSLRQRFNRDFWLDKASYFAQALDADKEPIRAVTSNPGHALWCGIVDDNKAPQLTERLMASDMFSGWGIRTLSASSPNYNPMSYHNGSIWPHDNSLVALGLRRYGYDKEAARVIEAVVGAGLRLGENRLPELYCGFPRDMKFNSSPVSYIVSCRPQAWAAAAPFLFLQTLLGVKPCGDGGVRLDPIQNELFYRCRISGMTIGENRVSFEVHQTDTGVIRRIEGDVPLRSTTATIS